MSLPPLNCKMVSVVETCLEAQQVGKELWNLQAAQGSTSPCVDGRIFPRRTKPESFVSGELPKTKACVYIFYVCFPRKLGMLTHLFMFDFCNMNIIVLKIC